MCIFLRSRCTNLFYQRCSNEMPFSSCNEFAIVAIVIVYFGYCFISPSAFPFKKKKKILVLFSSFTLNSNCVVIKLGVSVNYGLNIIVVWSQNGWAVCIGNKLARKYATFSMCALCESLCRSRENRRKSFIFGERKKWSNEHEKTRAI